MFIVLWVRLDFKLFLMDMLKPIFLSWRPNTKSFLQLKRRKVWQNVSTQGLIDFAVIDAGYIYVIIKNRSTQKFVISVCENYNSKINVEWHDRWYNRTFMFILSEFSIMCDFTAF